MGFCNFESVLQRNKERSKCRLCSKLECLCAFPTSDDINVHRLAGYSLLFVDSNDEVFFQEEYLGEDAAKQLLEKENKNSETFSKPKPVCRNGKCIEKRKFVIFVVSNLQSIQEITEKFWIMIM